MASDAGIFRECSLRAALAENTISGFTRPNHSLKITAISHTSCREMTPSLFDRGCNVVQLDAHESPCA